MTLTINDTFHDQRPDPAHRPARHPAADGWEVSWLPGQPLDRNTAITAMILAEHRRRTPTCTRGTGSGRTSRAGPPNSASPAPRRVAAASQPPPDRIHHDEQHAGGQLNREAAD